MDQLTTHLKDNVYVFSSSGLVSIIMTREKAANNFKLMSVDENDDEIHVQKVATRIRKELSQIP